MRILVVTLFACAVASPAFAQTVACDGSESTGTGVTSCPGTDPHKYAYPVTGTGIVVLQIGTDDCNPANYSNWCEPPDWTHAIQNISAITDFKKKTPHGVVSGGKTGVCPCIIAWSGPPIAAWTFGFDHTSKQSHDVGWNLLGAPGASENWGAPVGNGVGPVHAPWSGEGRDIPAVSEWGLAVMVLLVLAAGTMVIRRARTLKAHA